MSVALSLHASGTRHSTKAQVGSLIFVCSLKQCGGFARSLAFSSLHHPCFVVTLRHAISPSQDAPSGQGAHVWFIGSAEESLRYCVL